MRSAREKLMLVFLSGLAYFLIDAPVQLTGVLPSFAGIKNFLPFTLGLFFGIYGVAGCIIGCVLSALIVNPNVDAVLYECACTAINGLGMFYGWHALTRNHRVSFKAPIDYARYICLLAVLSGLCLRIPVSLAYFLTGLFIGVPVNILFSSLLYIEPVMPLGLSYNYDAVFVISSGIDGLDGANEIVEEKAFELGIKMKRVLEIQSCLEELLIRIQNAEPESEVHVMIQFGNAISARLNYAGTRYNPFRISEDEDEIDIMSLKIIKHRALRASFSYSEGINKVHVVI